MRRRVLLCLALILVSACNGDKIGQPIATPTSNTKQISDAVHTAGNPDFFFLPPMVPNPSGGTNWDAGAFNPSLAPTVEICATATAGAACASSPLSYPASLRAADEQYAYNWKVPTDAQVYYRITVKVGSKPLGWADVQAGTAAEVKHMGTGEFIPLVDGRTLPIKFRIERYALCAIPSVGGCTSASADIATTPLTVSTGTPTSDQIGISDVKGVFIPAQGGPDAMPETVTLAACDDLSPVIHRQTIGDCVRVTLDPARTLSTHATVFICSVGIDAAGLPNVDPEQIRMYRSDADGVAVLQPANACKPHSPGGVATANPSLREMFASLAHGEFKRAANEAVALVSPKALYAAMFIDLGGGGETCCFSDFQFGVPSVLIYGPSLFKRSIADPRQNEQTLAEAAGMTVTVWDATTWQTKTAADFARFSAIVFGDPDCIYSTTHLNAARANKTEWSSVIRGPVVVIGTDPVFHQPGHPEALTLMSNAIKFAASVPATTGLSASLSCYYDTESSGATAVDWLDGVAAFSVRSRSGLGESAHILNGLHPVMNLLDDAGLSGWGFSVHEALPTLDSYPTGFEALVTINNFYPTEGQPANLPYIIARGSKP